MICRAAVWQTLGHHVKTARAYVFEITHRDTIDFDPSMTLVATLRDDSPFDQPHVQAFGPERLEERVGAHEARVAPEP